MVKHNKNIEAAFDEAVALATNTSKKLPPDIRLALYARYKHATRRNHVVSFDQLADNDLRGAFKYNAMIQVKNLTITEAKTEYIELVNLHIKD
ncbi:acyl-CoA-binding protein [Flavimarina sp. Hel_I_48]|uniref:acyl-CoA-binding protein n=1 Tax=Flavimarina sp. Hel_I_48 TaxID=1392488 RepID=UPI0004DF8488|nr:acyl-CoA-binding protein [Flavimarina sp. Hel_I_48]